VPARLPQKVSTAMAAGGGLRGGGFGAVDTAGSGQPVVSAQAGGEGVESSPAERDLGVPGDEKLGVSTRSPESQPCPGLHPQQCGHRARRGILPLCPAPVRPPGSPASSSGVPSTGQSWSCGSGARGGPSNDPRAGTPLLGELGLLSLGRRRHQGDLRAAASV